jgi:hypothetical protein
VNAGVSVEASVNAGVGGHSAHATMSRLA